MISVNQLSSSIQLQKKHPKIINPDTVENRTKRTQIGPQPTGRTPQRNHSLRALSTVSHRYQSGNHVEGISSDHRDSEPTRGTFRTLFAHELTRAQ